MHAVATHEDDVADLAALNTLGQLLECLTVTRHQAHADLEILFRSFLAECEHPLARWAVHRHGFFHEDVQTFLDGVCEMNPPERWWRRQDHHVARLQAIHRVLVGVKPEKPALLRYIHERANLWVPAQSTEAVLELGLERVGHRDELNGAKAGRAERIADRARAASAATHEGQLYGVIAGRVNARDDGACQGRSGGRHQEFAA